MYQIWHYRRCKIAYAVYKCGGAGDAIIVISVYTYMSITQNTRNLLDAAIVVIAGSSIVGAFLRTWSIGRRPAAAAVPHLDASDTSAIIAYYTAGHNLINAGTGMVDGMHYSMYLTTPAERQYGEAFVAGSAVIYVLDLPFN